MPFWATVHRVSWCAAARRRRIWATFERIPDSVKKQLEKCGYEANDDLLLYREINAEGKGSCRVNGMPATAAVVRDISAGCSPFTASMTARV